MEMYKTGSVPWQINASMIRGTDPDVFVIDDIAQMVEVDVSLVQKVKIESKRRSIYYFEDWFIGD